VVVKVTKRGGSIEKGKEKTLLSGGCVEGVGGRKRRNCGKKKRGWACVFGGTRHY